MKDTSNPHLHHSAGGAAISVHVETHAGRDEIKEILPDGTLRVAIQASGTGDKVNAPLLEYLAHALGVPVNRMEVVAGSSSADKLVAILNVDSAQLHKRITGLVGK